MLLLLSTVYYIALYFFLDLLYSFFRVPPDF